MEYGEYGILAMLNPCHIVRFCIYVACGGDCTLVPRSTVEMGTITRVRVGSDGGIPDDASPGIAWCRTGVPR